MASSNFYLLFTDGDATHLPSPEEIQRGYKTTDHDGSTEKAHLTFASEMMKQIEKVEKGFTSDKIPDGYSVWPCRRKGDLKKTDWYIFGHPSHVKFDSFAQFAKHIHFLKLPKPPGDCPCKVCRKFSLPANHVIRQDPAPARIYDPSLPLNTPVAQLAAPSAQQAINALLDAAAMLDAADLLLHSS